MIRILIADDHAIVRKGLKQLILEEYPSAIVGEVEDVETLIVKVIKEEWDVVVCDINMPGRSGVEALHQLKEINPKLPVLMMSMYPEDQYALRVLKAGASGYLNKGSVHDELIKAIQTVLIGRKYITPSIAEKLAGAFSHDDNKQPHELLSDREFDVLKMLAAGKSVSEIADQFSLSATTVSTYRARILEKMGMKTNADITRYALEKKLI
ncbi:MAG: response regulator transcription factor [Chitinophagaceae bacterium]|nr:MAG: response regulator transcription factor [Chitinophagaceae bacterium]